jgi:hypothetical protein
MKVIRRLGGTSRFHLQGRISQARNQREAGSKQGAVLPKIQLNFNGIHGVIAQS